jgi:enolase
LRDGDLARYRGLGCRKAVANINGEINRTVSGRAFDTQADLDRTLIDLDGTPNKSRLGANAVLAVSIAFARAQAAEAGIPLWQSFATLIPYRAPSLPRLTINLFSGGKHAGSQVAIQDVLLVPQAASVDESLAWTFDVYQTAAEFSQKHFGLRLLRADEGGLAPPFNSSETMISAALECIDQAGYTAGKHFALAVDVAASQFYSGGMYQLDRELLEPRAMADRVESWTHKYPVISVEDGLAENDWEFWPVLANALAPRCLAMGDDLLCTNAQRIRKAIEMKAATALLLKPNQAGTLTEAAEAYVLARGAGWSVTVSVRSGETEDNWAADLAFGWAADYFKNGSITQSERLAKYNRLLEIESQFISAWHGYL